MSAEDLAGEINKQYLSECLTKCFKNMDASKIDEISTKLKDDGLSEEMRFQAKVDDLVLCGLNKYQARALIIFWKGEGEEGHGRGQDQHDERRGNEGNAAPNNQIRPEADAPRPGDLLNITEFRLDWNDIFKRTYRRESAREVLRKGERPSPGLLIEIVDEIHKQVMARVQNAGKASFVTVYNQIIQGDYKNCFKETLGHGTECVGGLLHKLKTKYDNENRPNRNLHRRDPDAVNRIYQQPRGKFSYGCPQWRLRDMPPGEDEDTVKTSKEKMQEIFRETRPKFWDIENIKDMMQKTYKPQRDMINSNIEAALASQKKKVARSRKRKRNEAGAEGSNDEAADEVEEPPPPEITINQVSEAWPFLFTYSGMLIHYKNLTNVDIELELTKFKEEGQMNALLQFFRDLNDDDEEGDYYSTVLKQMDKQIKKDKDRGKDNHPELRAISLMLPNFFEENSFIKVVEESATMESEENEAPQYPGLTVPAKHLSLFAGKKFFLGVDSQFHYSMVSFEKAFLCVYMMYYVFNLDYAPSCQVTLEFLQRFMFHVDPPTGNKRPLRGSTQNRQAVKGQFSTKVVHPCVSRLYKKVQKYLKNGNEQESDPDDDSPETSGSEQDVF